MYDMEPRFPCQVSRGRAGRLLFLPPPDLPCAAPTPGPAEKQVGFAPSSGNPAPTTRTRAS